MPLAIGTRLGPYEILAPLGVGGMGEVYRAVDTQLRRDAALKVVPPAFASDPDRMSRFEREARVLASLSHPNIASVYGIEESGTTRALVMELVEGPTLAERIEAGPIPAEEAIEIAKQVVAAVEYAHDHGVIHRDLKPANIKITPEGTVKVLDFGLAKALTGDGEFMSGSPSHSPTFSPTISMRATQAGMILGTAAYMAPEQARGKAVDRRADIWAFGVVLFEMLTGESLFVGESAAEIMASALKEEPKLERLPAATPAALRKLIERCLNKDPKLRLQAIGEARIILNGPMQEAAPPPAGAVHSKSRLAPAPWVLVSVLASALATLAYTHFHERPPAQASMRLQVVPPGAIPAKYLAISPDGRNIAFLAGSGGPEQVWIRAMDAFESRALAGTEGAIYPFWSPDGESIGFFSQGKLKKIDIAGGPVQTLCDAADGRGASWSRDGVILFSAGPTSPILRVPSSGGTPTPVTKVLDSAAGGDRYPVFLPDGEHFLYNSAASRPAGLYIGSLSGSSTPLASELSRALYAPPATAGGSGYLLFRRELTLMGQPFDAKSLKLTGAVFPIAERVPEGVNTGFGEYSVSDNGTLLYLSSIATNRELVWMDRSGKRLATIGKPDAYWGLSLAPDEKTAAVEVQRESQLDIWIEDLNRAVMSRFTFRPGGNETALWSPDGSQIIYSYESAKTFSTQLYRKPSGGNGQEELLIEGGVNGYPTSWSPDGKRILFMQTGRTTATDIWMLPLTGDRKPVPYLQTPFDEGQASFSPDGKWVAYSSNESGQYQVYVQTFPASGAKYQISASGGVQPRWRRDGKELYYIAPDQKLTAVPIRSGATIEPGSPETLFLLSSRNVDETVMYAATRDGRRFLVNAQAGGENGSTAPPIQVITNWQAGLKK